MNDAIKELEGAAAQAPGDPAVLNRLGNAHKEAGDHARAEQCYRQALALDPGYAAAEYNLAMVLHIGDRLVEAEALFRRLVKAHPGDVEAWTHLATILCKRGRYGEGSTVYAKALELAPADPFLWMAMANAVLANAGPPEDAERFLLRAVELKPDLANAWQLLGVARRRLERGDAVAAFERALEIDPTLDEALNGLGQVLRDQGRFAEAEARFRDALRSAPASAVLWNGLGCVLFEQGRLPDAADAFRKAVRSDPGLAYAHQNLGAIHSQLGERGEALEQFGAAVNLMPADAALRESLLHELQQVCDWSRLDDLWRRQRQSLAEGDRSITPFSLLSLPSTPAEQRECAARFAAQISLSAAADRRQLAFRFTPGPRERLRIGYLSGDLHDHVMAYVMAEVFELHDRTGFEIVAYSYGPDDGSPMRKRVAAAFDRFVDVRALSHLDAASRIHADGIDILVDIKGFTEHARSGIAALRPAPVQASYMGFPATMSSDFVDYFIVDRYVVPPSQRAHYGEALAFLPDTYYANDRRRGDPDPVSRAEAGLPAEGLVFCCFNQTYKILPETFRRWMRIMAEVPGSLLWLLDTNRWAKDNLRREAETQGIEGSRLVFAPRLPAAQHLRRVAVADVFLDTLPYNAHTTATDALWAGVPVVTLPGETFPSRVAGSLLRALEVQELIATSEDEFHRMAVELAVDPARRAALRRRILDNRGRTALFDTPRFTRNLEAAYRRMWARYAAGQAPADITV